MSIRDVIKKASLVFSGGYSRPPFWTQSTVFDNPNGAAMTPESALGITAYYSGVTTIAQTLAQLPLILYERIDKGKRRATDRQLYSMLHDEPNEYMTSFTFREILQGHLLTRGNAYAEIGWDRATETPETLFPLRPDRMRIDFDGKQVWYVYTMPSGEQRKLQPWQVLHIPGYGFDGFQGYDPLTLHRRPLRMARTQEQFGSQFFENGSTLSGVIQHPGPQKLTENAVKMMRKSWEQMHQGLSNSHKVAILQEGVTFKEIGIPPENAQFLESRNFQVLEIARILHIPPHMLAHLSDATFSNIEHMGIEFVKYTMDPWFKRWEQEIHRKLLTKEERKRYFAEFLVDGLLRGDTQARYQAYATGRQWGWLSPNDVRNMENMNPIEGGDIYLIPLNMVDAQMIDDVEPQEKELKAISPARRRAAVRRAALVERHRAQFLEASKRIVKHEIRNVRKAASVHLKDVMTFEAWLDEWYGETFRKYVVKNMTPVMRALAESVYPMAAAEAGVPEEIRPEDEAKLAEYIEGFADRYIAVHKGQALLAAEDGTIDEMFGEWEEDAAEKITAAETVGMANRVVQIACAVAGVALVWHAIGSETCPICNEMDGQPVTTLRPPLHDGCVCQVGPR